MNIKENQQKVNEKKNQKSSENQIESRPTSLTLKKNAALSCAASKHKLLASQAAKYASSAGLF
ncbi:MAG TPA: hypothetical protein VGA99_06055 [bacterium]